MHAYIYRTDSGVKYIGGNVLTWPAATPAAGKTIYSNAGVWE